MFRHFILFCLLVFFASTTSVQADSFFDVSPGDDIKDFDFTSDRDITKYDDRDTRDDASNYDDDSDMTRREDSRSKLLKRKDRANRTGFDDPDDDEDNDNGDHHSDTDREHHDDTDRQRHDDSGGGRHDDTGGDKFDGSQFDKSSFIDTDFSKSSFRDGFKTRLHSRVYFDAQEVERTLDKLRDMEKRFYVKDHDPDRDDDFDDTSPRAVWEKLTQDIPKIGDWVPSPADRLDNGGFELDKDNGRPVPYRLNGHVDIQRGLPWEKDD